MSEEVGTVEAAPVESTPTETESSSEAIGGEAIQAKLQASEEEQSGDGSEVNSEEKDETVKPEAEADSEVPEELSKFIQEKGLDPKNLDPMKILDMARNSEAKMQETLRERDLEREKIKQAQLNKDVEAVVNPQSEEDKPLSPLQQVEEDFHTAINALANIHGLQSIEEVREAFPDAYMNLVEQRALAKDEAYLQEFDWREEQKNKAESERQSKESIERESALVKEKAMDNFNAYRDTNPDLVQDFIDHGTNDLLDELASITNVPVDYFVAHKPFMDMFVKMTNALKVVGDLPNRDKEIKNGVEKQIKRTKEAEMVSPSEALPDDHNAVAKMGIHKYARGGTSILN